MNRLEEIIEATLKIAENAMQKEGFCNPKVVLFYRNDQAELGTYMIDLAYQEYFDARLDIMEKVGKFLATKKGEGIRSFDTLVFYGETGLTIDVETKQTVMATALNEKGESITRIKEIQRYILPDNPERQFFNLNELEIDVKSYKSPILQTLLTNFTQK